jgi:hypothetical protein
MKKLLTISIPTYNRKEYLNRCLESINIALSKINAKDKKLIAVQINDNSENSESESLIENYKYFETDIYYNRNSTNIGSDRNLAQSYLVEDSEYVLVLGDDDFLSDCFFIDVIPVLKKNNFDIVFLKYFGLTFDEQYNFTYTSAPKIRSYNCPYSVLMDRNIAITFISGLILRRDFFDKRIVEDGLGTNLVQVNLVFNMLQKNASACFIKRNLIAATRNNTGGYDPTIIFLEGFYNILQSFENLGLSKNQIFKMKCKMLQVFYTRSFAQYMRKTNKPLNTEQLNVLDRHFNEYYLYRFLLKKLFKRNSKVNTYLLSLVSVIFNIYYYPYKIGDYIYHTKNYILNK